MDLEHILIKGNRVVVSKNQCEDLIQYIHTMNTKTRQQNISLKFFNVCNPTSFGTL
jgi:hypothetical protein